MTQASTWEASLSAQIGRRVAELRTKRKLTAKQLSDLLVNRGVRMTRPVLANLENGRRPTVSVAELLAFSHVLGVPLVALLVDYGRNETVELLPNEVLLMEHAVSWLRDGSQTTRAGQAFTAWRFAVDETRGYSAWLASNPDATSEQREQARTRAAQAREIARLHDVDLPAPPTNAQDVDLPVRPEASRPLWMEMLRPPSGPSSEGDS